MANANYRENNVTNVQFTDIDPIVSLKTRGSKITRGAYALDNEGNIIAPQKVINAIDIDWNKAIITGIDGNIETTAQLLGLIGQLNDNNNSNSDSIESLEQAIESISSYLNNINNGDGYNHVIITQEEYDALQSYSPKTIYFILSDDEENENPSNEENGELIDINNVSTVLSSLYVDDGDGEVFHSENQITLQPGKKYKLRGTLAGSILIDATQSGVPADNTEIVLNNVTIVNKSTNFAIKYLIPTNGKGYKDLIITLAPKSKNYIICDHTVEIDDDQPGAIYSTNNLTIQGSGYLACYNLGGHGVRGSELKLLAPHMYVHSSHDAIHAKKIYICGGTYYINHANDAFGTGIGGKIIYSYGKLYVNELTGKTFNAKSGEVDGVNKEGKIIKVENFDITFIGSSNNYETSNNVIDILNLYNDTLILEYDSEAQAKLGAATGSDVEIINGVYQVTKPYIYAAGLINKSINIPNTIDDATIFLDNAIISTNEIIVEGVTLNSPSIISNSKTGQVKIFALNDSYNVIINNCIATTNNGDADAIKSEHNLDVEIKNNAYIYITSNAGDGIDGTDVNITDSKGVLMLHRCGERGIKGTNIIIGPKGSTPLGRLQLITSPSNEKYSTFDGAVIATENCTKFGNVIPIISNDNIMTSTGYADIFARKGSSANKGSLYITNNELLGVVICNSIGAIIQISADNANNLYYNEIIAHEGMIASNIPESNNDIYFAYAYNNYHISYNE